MSLHPPIPHQARRVLVTGGSGFIGSHLVEHLLSLGQNVTVIDNLSTGRDDNLAAVRSNPNLRIIHGDLSQCLDALPQGETFDSIYHLAAAVGVRLVVEQPIACIETNIDQTSRLLRFAMTHGPAGKPAHTFIASSSEVYGKSEKTPFREDDDVVYGPTTKARWSYAASKAIDEYLALAYHQQHALPVVVARFFNTVGPRQVGRYGMVLPNFVAAALAGKPLLVHGDGQQVRCFCDVRDIVPAIRLLTETPACAGRVFNIGSDHEISMHDLAELVIKTLRSTSEKVSVPYDRAFGSGFEDLRRRQPDLSRIREAIGFRPSIDLAQTIRDIATCSQRTMTSGFTSNSNAHGATP